jgi:exopolysaccharide production protein ExoZ
MNPDRGTFVKTIWSIQTLRAIAALAVVIVHITFNASGYTGNAVIAEVGSFGHIGVDIFFVISGFIMYLMIDARNISTAEFLIDRASRIWPAYIICSFLLLVLAVAGRSLVVPSSYDFALSLLLIPHFAPSHEIVPYLVVGWTLSYEIFFYAILAISLVARPRHISLMAGILFALIISGMMFHPESPVGKTFTDPILLEFLCGVGIGVLWRRKIVLPKPVAILAIVSALGIATLFFREVGTGWERFFHRGIPAMLIVAGSLSFEEKWIFKTRLGLLLGAASYSIYLTHLLVLIMFGRIWKITGIPSEAVLIAVPLIGSVICGVAFHLLIEIPTTRAARILMSKRQIARSA